MLAKAIKKLWEEWNLKEVLIEHDITKNASKSFILWFQDDDDLIKSIKYWQKLHMAYSLLTVSQKIIQQRKQIDSNRFDCIGGSISKVVRDISFSNEITIK